MEMMPKKGWAGRKDWWWRVTLFQSSQTSLYMSLIYYFPPQKKKKTIRLKTSMCMEREKVYFVIFHCEVIKQLPRHSRKGTKSHSDGTWKFTLLQATSLAQHCWLKTGKTSDFPACYQGVDVIGAFICVNGF